MRRTLTIYTITILLLAAVAAPAFALAPAYTLLDGATATGAGTGQALYRPMGNFTCIATLAGTAPTSVTVTLDGSLDGVTYFSISGLKVFTTSGTAFPVTWQGPINYIRGNYVVKVGGGVDTAVSLTCSPGN